MSGSHLEGDPGAEFASSGSARSPQSTSPPGSGSSWGSKMASQGSGQQRVVHQDYMVRQRYSNALPPPPGPPKLLSVPQPGLNQYTMPHYASRMAREQDLNIVADAMLGMDIDPVGLPGYFDGDESAIQAPINPPPVHPKDRNLLRPLKSLGKPRNEVSDVSFLRRTQYTAEDRGTRPDRAGAVAPKRRAQDKSKDDPVHMLRTAIKGFDIANPESAHKGPDDSENIRGISATPAELDAWKNPKHPTKPNLKMLDYYPLLPDLSVATDDHGFAVFKINGNPTEVTDAPDPRMHNALLHPLEPSPRVAAEYQAKMAAHKADPEKNPPAGLLPLSYEFFLAKDDDTARNMARKFDVGDAEKESSDLYTHASEGGEKDSFRYSHIRIYDSGHQTDHRNTPYQEVAVSIYDAELERKRAEREGRELPVADGRQKAAYYYPVTHKVQLKPRRAVKLAQMGMSAPAADDDEEEKIDNLDVRVREADDEEEERRSKYNAALDTRDEVGG